MYKVAGYLLLPLLLINLTVAENRWTVLGLHIDQFIYAVTISIAWYVGSLSAYRRLVNIMIVIVIGVRVLEAVGDVEAIHEIGFAALAVIFAIAGAMIYGRNPILLHKQLVIFLALSIPIMLLQILGVSSLVMGWNIGYLDNGMDSLSMDEIGSFKEVVLHPTLFVEFDKLDYSIGQGRPVGLLYGSNPLSVFISIAVALNLAIVRKLQINFFDIVVTIAVVLAMSKLVFAVTILMYLIFLIFGSLERRTLALKLIGLFIVVMFLYYILFPGLLIANLSEGMVMISLMLRLVDLVKALGIENSFNQVVELGEIYRPSNVYEMQEGYTAFAIMLRSNLLIPVLLIIVSGSILYVKRLQNMTYWPGMVYVVTLLACILTQFGVPFVGTPSFQLLMGFALFPLFKKIWSRDSYRVPVSDGKGSQHLTENVVV